MVKKLIALLVVFVVGLTIFLVPQFRSAVTNSLSYSECDTPIQYRLGSVDPKFGLSNSEILQDLESASGIWSSAADKQLFSYSPNGDLVVNFVYDQRTALNNQIGQMQSQLDQTNTSLTQQIASYKQQVAAFEQKLAAYNAEVAKYNAQGGAPKDVYDSLKKEQQDLNAEGDSLNQMAKQLNLSTNSYNSNVSVLNGDVNQFNNELLQKPEEGLYSGTDNTITIYFANSHNELLHTLTHEFGHAMGMNHVADPKAIMYPSSTSTLQVTPDDVLQLQFVCRKQSVILHDLQAVALWEKTIIGQVQKNFVK